MQHGRSAFAVWVPFYQPEHCLFVDSHFLRRLWHGFMQPTLPCYSLFYGIIVTHSPTVQKHPHLLSLFFPFPFAVYTLPIAIFSFHVIFIIRSIYELT